MKKSALFAVFATMFVCGANASSLTGFYQTIDDETNKPKSIVAMYNCDDDEFCGRIVALYDSDGKISETISNPVRVAESVKGQPKMVGLDIIWDMEWDDDDNEYDDGKIMDPKKGSVYSSVIWHDKNDATKLNVRGKVGPFGRTQVWNVISADDLPDDLKNLDTSGWKPTIIKK